VPSRVDNLALTRGCLSIFALWDNVTSDQVCGSVSYNVTITAPDKTTMEEIITENNYTIERLLSNTSYSVTVAGINDAGRGEFSEAMTSDVAGDHS